MSVFKPVILTLALVSSFWSVATESLWQVNAPQGEFKHVDIHVQQGTWMNEIGIRQKQRQKFYFERH